MNKLKTMPKQSKKIFLNFILPLFLMFSAVVIIGAGCNPVDDDDDKNEDRDSKETPNKTASMQINNLKTYYCLFV